MWSPLCFNFSLCCTECRSHKCIFSVGNMKISVTALTSAPIHCIGILLLLLASLFVLEIDCRNDKQPNALEVITNNMSPTNPNHFLRCQVFIWYSETYKCTPYSTHGRWKKSIMHAQLVLVMPLSWQIVLQWFERFWACEMLLYLAGQSVADQLQNYIVVKSGNWLGIKLFRPSSGTDSDVFQISLSSPLSYLLL